MKIALRYDDYSAFSNVDFDLRVFETIAHEGFTTMVGVIPAIADVNWELGSNIPLRRLTTEHIRRLREFVPKHVEIGLHGYTHQAVTRWSGLFEFGDAVSYEKQLERIKDGKKYLEDSFGVEVSCFIPPWNSYGKTTVRALREAGFKTISGDAAFGPLSDGINYLPAACLPREISLATNCVKIDPDAVVTVVLHDYDFVESGVGVRGISFSDLRKLLGGLKCDGISGSTFADLNMDGDCGMSRASANQKLRQFSNSTLRFLLRPGMTSVYWSEAVAGKLSQRMERWDSFFKRLLSGYRSVFR